MKDVRLVAFQRHHSVILLELFGANRADIVTKYHGCLSLELFESLTVRIGLALTLLAFEICLPDIN